MARKKENVEFRFYEIPQGKSVLALTGEKWNKVYGHDVSGLHFHNLCEIGICYKGEGKLYFDKEEVDYFSNMLCVIPENYPHLTVSKGDSLNEWEYLYFDLRQVVAELFPDDMARQRQIIEKINSKAFLVSFDDNPTLFDLANLIIREEKNPDLYSKRLIDEYVRALALSLMRESSELKTDEKKISKDTRLTKLTESIKYIEEHYDEQIKAKDLAKVCSMSETNFRRVFEAQINMSPMDYLNLVRIQKACEIMKKNDYPMDVISSMCGFSTISTFNRNFRKFLDTSPYQWKINPSDYEGKKDNYKIEVLKGW